MSKRQIAFGVLCFLLGILVGIEIAANMDVLIRMVVIVAILLLLVYLALPYLSRRRSLSHQPQRMPRRRTGKK